MQSLTIALTAAPAERAWFGVVPVTSPVRTLRDGSDEHLSPERLQHAVNDAVTRGLVAKADVDVVASWAAAVTCRMSDE